MSFPAPRSASSLSSLPDGPATLPAHPDAAPGSAEGPPGQAELLQKEKYKQPGQGKLIQLEMMIQQKNSKGQFSIKRNKYNTDIKPLN